MELLLTVAGVFVLLSWIAKIDIFLIALAIVWSHLVFDGVLPQKDATLLIVLSASVYLLPRFLRHVRKSEPTL